MSNSNEIIGFRMNLDTAEEFYKRCIEREAVTDKEKIAVLKELVTELRAIKLSEQDLKRQIKGKRILRIKKG